MTVIKKKIFFIYGNTPNPSLIERALTAENSGKYESYIVFWSRKNSDISIPFSKILPLDRFIDISLGDPRGNIFRRIILSLLFSIKLRAKIRSIMPDIIYPVNSDMLGLSMLSNYLLKPVKIVYDFQDQKGEKLNFLYKYLYRISARKVSTVFVRSLGFIDHIQKNNLFSDEVPIKYFAEAPLGWDSWGKKFPNNFEEKLIVGYFGNIRGTKQIKSLLMATQMINKEGKNVQLNFAGVGSEVNLVTKAVGEFNYVNYSGPFDYFKDYKEMFLSADIIYAAYPTNLSNYKFHEARRFHESIAAGIPIIVSQGTYMANRVIDLNVGWTIDSKGSSESVQEIYKIFSDSIKHPTFLKNKKVKSDLRKQHLMEFYIESFLNSFSD